MNNNYVYFHKGDYIPTTTFTAFPCKHSEVYVSGLDENNVYLEDRRGLRLYHDEQVFLCTDNTLFSVYTLEDNTYIEDIRINWDTNCTLHTEPYIDESTKNTTLINKETQNKTLNSSSTILNIESTLNTTSLTRNEEISNSITETVIHKPIGDIPKSNYDSYFIHTFSILLLTMSLCMLLIHYLKKGEK